MGLLEGIIAEQIQFFFVVHRLGAFNKVALHVFFGDGDALLNVLTNQTGGSIGVLGGFVTHSEVEFEPLRDGGFESGYLVEQVHRFGPRRGMGIMNQGFSIQGQREGKSGVVIVGFHRPVGAFGGFTSDLGEHFSRSGVFPG